MGVTFKCDYCGREEAGEFSREDTHHGCVRVPFAWFTRTFLKNGTRITLVACSENCDEELSRRGPSMFGKLE
jgi:hypothetical protein